MKAWMPKKEIAYQTCHLMYNFLWACNILTCEMFIYSFSWRVSKTLILTSGDNDTWIGSRPKSFVLQTSFDVKIKIVTASWTEKSLLVACWSQVSVLFCLLFFFFSNSRFKIQIPASLYSWQPHVCSTTVSMCLCWTYWTVLLLHGGKPFLN